MKTLGEIKQLMVAGETAKADASLKELLAAEPENLQAKMLYGACRQLLGDEEAFKRIHDELAPEMEKLEAEEPRAEIVSLWKKYDTLFERLIVGAMIVGAVAVGVTYVLKTVLAQRQVACLGVYAGPPMQEIRPVKGQKEMQPVEPQEEIERRTKLKAKVRTAEEANASSQTGTSTEAPISIR